MIYYFSGTGNSKWVAEELARRTNDEVQSIAALQRDGTVSVYANCGSRIGIVFPIYAWGAPMLVERFCKSLKMAEGVYAYAVCTCGDEAGLALKRLRKMFAYRSAWSVVMPNNYVIGFDLDSPELEASKIRAAHEKLAQIASSINARGTVYDVHEGPAAGVKTVIVRPLFNTFAMSTREFIADQNCNGCGLCARICPIGAIEMKNDRPVWVKKQCTQCL
ncbi:MAG: (4Fe-4S)-binding protein, partial [Clostridiales bacterium]|nr:(4Fe-4S)-binding protein [Clostridiales bacterium]